MTPTLAQSRHNTIQTPHSHILMEVVLVPLHYETETRRLLSPHRAFKWLCLPHENEVTNRFGY
jgi:hypothetical protein